MRKSLIQNVWDDWEGFFVEDGILYKRHIVEDHCGHEHRAVLVLPLSLCNGHAQLTQRKSLRSIR